MDEQRKHDVSVLYVEDDSAAREEIILFLGHLVRDVTTAANGRDGLDLYRQKQFDLIVTDIRMPDMDGLQMARAVREIFKGTPIIVTTAHSDSSFMMDAIDIGIDQYVVKPINMKKLAGAIGKSVEVIEYRRAHKRYLAERETLIADLQKALAENKILYGILSICSVCKKIKDNDGTWKQMEAYIHEHSEADFSHGYCPECAKKVMEEIRQIKKNREKT